MFVSKKKYEALQEETNKIRDELCLQKDSATYWNNKFHSQLDKNTTLSSEIESFVQEVVEKAKALNPQISWDDLVKRLDEPETFYDKVRGE